VKTKDFALLSIEDILDYLCKEQRGLPDSQQGRWDSLHEAIMIVQKARREILAEEFLGE